MSKNFEYMGTGRPILIIGPTDSDIGQIISEFSNSTICHYDDENTCENFLKKTIENWRNKTEKPPESAIRQKYSRKEIARQLAVILDNCLPRLR